MSLSAGRPKAGSLISHSYTASKLGISPRTLKRRILDNTVPAVCVGNGRYKLTYETHRKLMLFGLRAELLR